MRSGRTWRRFLLLLAAILACNAADLDPARWRVHGDTPTYLMSRQRLGLVAEALPSADSELLVDDTRLYYRRGAVYANAALVAGIRSLGLRGAWAMRAYQLACALVVAASLAALGARTRLLPLLALATSPVILSVARQGVSETWAIGLLALAWSLLDVRRVWADTALGLVSLALLLVRYECWPLLVVLCVARGRVPALGGLALVAAALATRKPEFLLPWRYLSTMARIQVLVYPRRFWWHNPARLALAVLPALPALAGAPRRLALAGLVAYAGAAVLAPTALDARMFAPAVAIIPAVVRRPHRRAWVLAVLVLIANVVVANRHVVPEDKPFFARTSVGAEQPRDHWAEDCWQSAFGP